MAYVMVVDDDHDSRDLLCKLLEGDGHEVACVSNGREALAAILSRTPELIVLDLLMPEMDGPSLLEILRSYLRLQNLPVIILTALTDHPMIDRARHLRVNAILIKSRAMPEDIIAAVRRELPQLPH